MTNDAATVANGLANVIEHLCAVLLGEPNRAASSSRELRWGSRGSLSVTVAGPYRGHFADFEAGVHGDALDLAKHVLGIGTAEAMIWSRPFLRSPESLHATSISQAEATASCADATKECERAVKIWNDSVALPGTPAEAFLNSKGIAIDHLRKSLQVLRFSRECPVRTTTGEIIYNPALIALFSGIECNKAKGIQRIFITNDGRKADPAELGIQSGKMMLGHVRNSAVKLIGDDSIEDRICISEGVVTGLSGMALGFGPVWALGSAGAIGKFEPPADIRKITILVDNDDAGRKNAHLCAERLEGAGRTVEMKMPPTAGADWNDFLCGDNE